MYNLKIQNYYTAGCPVSVVMGGLPILSGPTVYDKLESLKNKYDEIRQMIIKESPHGDSLVIAFLTEPEGGDAKCGVIYAGYTYAAFCGSAQMAVAKALYDSFGQDEFLIDTLNGKTVVSKRTIHDKTLFSIENNNGVYCGEGLTSSGIAYSIAGGGNYFAIINADQLGLSISMNELEKFRRMGVQFLKEIPQKYTEIDINEIMFCDSVVENGNKVYRSCIVYGDGVVDKAPCGSGSCARMALLYEKKELNVGQEFIHESIFGNRFYGRITRNETVNGQLKTFSELSGEVTAVTDW